MARSPTSTKPTPPRRESDFDELKLEAYRQASEDFRQINQIFWQAPGIIITITGGLAVAVATLKFSAAVQSSLLVFAGICNAIWALLIFKLRFDVMNKLLNRSNAIYSHGSDSVKRKLPDKLVMWCFVAILSLTAVGCFMGAR